KKIGITYEATGDRQLIDLANQMTRAHDLLRAALLDGDGGDWNRAYEKASEEERDLLNDYRSCWGATIQNEIRTGAKGRDFRLDEKNDIFTINLESKRFPKEEDKSDALRDASWQLKALARRKWGASTLLVALGYEDSNREPPVIVIA